MGTITLTVMTNTPEDKANLHMELKRRLTGQFLQRAFENDVASLGSVRAQVQGEGAQPRNDRLGLLRNIVLPLDVNKDGKLDDEEVKGGIEFALPFMKGFGQIGFD